METKEIKGSCLCSKVKYEIYPPFLAFHYCYCPRCQKATGSAFISNIFVNPKQFKWTSGDELVIRFDLPEARSFSTCFCRVCGSPLPHLTRDGTRLVVPAGSLDDDPIIRPESSIWWEYRPIWFKDINEIHKYPASYDANISARNNTDKKVL